MFDPYQLGKDALTVIIAPVMVFVVKLSNRVSKQEQSNSDMKDSQTRIEVKLDGLITTLLERK